MEEKKKESNLQFFLELLVFLFVVLLLKFYAFEIFWVNGGSMCPTINQLNGECHSGKGEFAFVNKFRYLLGSPHRGDIVVVLPPHYKEHKEKYIKRVIGVPGDIVEVSNGDVYISNPEAGIPRQKLEESYLSEKNQGNTSSSLSRFVLEEDQYIVFGDNRTASSDSRLCFAKAGTNCKINSPYLTEDQIIGRAEFVIWPFWKWRIFDNSLPLQETTEEVPKDQ